MESNKISDEIIRIEDTETVVMEKVVPTEEIETVTMETKLPTEEIKTKVLTEEIETVMMEKKAPTEEIKTKVPTEEVETVMMEKKVPTEEIETVMKEKVPTEETRAEKVTVDVEKQQEKKKTTTKKGSLYGKLCQVFLRLLVVGSMAAACAIMIFSEQTVDIGGFFMRASYRVSPTFKFFIGGTAVVCVYSMLSVPMVYCCYKKKIFHFLDTIALALAIASASAATAVGHIAKFGNDTTGWMKVCNYYERYCMRSMISIGCSYFGIICLLIICAVSSNAKK